MMGMEHTKYKYVWLYDELGIHGLQENWLHDGHGTH